MLNIDKIFKFFDIATDLKTTLRWTTFPNGRKESSADHSWSLSLMAFLIMEELHLSLDQNKVIKMCIVHDLPESITGDFDSYEVEKGKFSRNDKNMQEKMAIKRLEKILPENHGRQIFDLWSEYEEQKSPESKFVKALDKIETIYQITKNGHRTFDDHYEHMGLYGNKQVRDFPELTDVLDFIKKELKKEYLETNHVWKSEYDIK